MSALSDRAIGGLRDAFLDADYTVTAIGGLVGTEAHEALARNETTPALRRTADGSALATLTRLWPLQAPVGLAEAGAALPGLVDELCAGGVLERSGSDVRAVVDVRPYADDESDWWVASDLTPGLDGRPRRMDADHVLGVSPASTSLAQLTVRTSADLALDLGTGSGVQALHLSRHCRRVVATDLSPRCLDLAVITARLNDVDVDLRQGDLYAPVADERFDLIVSNPPFVISPPDGEVLTYRDSGRPGDDVVRSVVVEGASLLAAGGWCQVLANWVHVDGEDWSERLAGWIRPTGCDAWVVQREVVDVARYVEMWLDDAGLRGSADYLARYDHWLDWFERNGISAVGFGWLSLRNTGRTAPHLLLEEWPYEIEQPLGPHVAAWADRHDRLDDCTDEVLLGSSLVRAADLVEERQGAPGDEDPASIVLRSQRGMRRARQVSTAVAAMVGASDGELTLGQIAAALAELLDADPVAVRDELVVAARELVAEGALDLPV